MVASTASVSLRSPRPADIDALGKICFDAFGAINATHGFPSDMPSVEVASGLVAMVTTVPGIEGIVTEREGRPVGSAFLWPDGPVGGIGPVTVAPTAQDGNVGMRMMRWIVERGDELGLRSQRLVQAAFNARSMALYTKMGFDVKEPLSVMQGPAMGRQTPGYVVRPLTTDEIGKANALCEKVHGHARATELGGAAMRGEAHGAFVDGRMTAYATTIGFFGHAVAETTEGLKALIAAAEEISGAGILVPARNAELLRWCMEEGLRIQYPATLMARGFYEEPQGAFLASILY